MNISLKISHITAGVTGKIAGIIERVRSDYTGNLAGRPRGYRAKRSQMAMELTGKPVTPAVDQAERSGA